MQQNPETALEVLKSKDAEVLRFDLEVITSKEQQKDCEDWLILARQAYNRAEDMRKSLVDPLRVSEQRINTMFKQYTIPLGNKITQRSVSLSNWRKEQSDVSETKLLTEAEEYRQKRKEAKGTGEIVPLPSLNMNPPPKTSYANMGSVSYREMPDIQIVDPNLIPRDLCDPSMRKIRMRVMSGIVDIPGCVIGKKFSPTTRLYK
jgi:hypothetical protein